MCSWRWRKLKKASVRPGDAMPTEFTATMRGILRLDPANGQALYYVGLAELKLGHRDVARSMWNNALAVTAADDPIAVSIRNGLDGLSGERTVH